MSNSKNLILCLSVGIYSDVKFVSSSIVSLRKYYSGPVCMIINKKSPEMIDFLKKHDVDISFVNTEMTPESVMYYRWILPRKVLLERYKDVENVIIPDVRDLVYQDDPFKYLSGKPLDLALETKTIKECPYNTKWVKNMYGEEAYQLVKDQLIICGGTMSGKRDAIIELCEHMMAERDRLGDTFVDQGTLNVFHAQGKFPETQLHETGDHLVATIGHSLGVTTVNEDGVLFGKTKDIIPSMVHQYDRHKDIEKLIIENANRPL